MNPEYLIFYHENRLGIRFFEYILLVLIEQKQYDTLTEIYDQEGILFMQMIESLEKEAYVKWHGTKTTELSLRKRGEDLFKNINKLNKYEKSDVNIWIDAWRDMFPAGINTAGYRYRGNRLEVLKKMSKFVTLYPYTKEEIFEATKRYIDRFAIKGYTYMQMAHYFIEKKDSGSSLASECESLKESKTNPTESPSYGRTVK